MSGQLYELSAFELRQLIRDRKISSLEATQAVLDRIDQVEDKVKAYVTVTADIALQRAREIDERISKGEDVGPLGGVPIAIKDNMSTKGILTTCSSKILYNYKPVYDATVIEKLYADGAVIIGKTNLDEFAMGSSTENSGFHTTRNPWDLNTVPGGSSGGSAAAVAADECFAALGSDTGGSIRQPASFCGIVGLKPTYGRVSRYGLVAFASSLDQIGPMTKDVKDCALLLNTIAGHDPRDSTSQPIPVPNYLESLSGDIKGLRIGIPKEFFAEGIQPEVTDAVMKAVSVLESLGAECKETSMPNVHYGLATYYIIAPAEASSNLARYDGVRYGLRDDKAQDPISMFAKSRE